MGLLLCPQGELVGSSPGADLGFLKGGLFFGKALVLEARGPRGTCPPDFLKRGHRGAPCYEEMYLDLSITSYNAMLSGAFKHKKPLIDSDKYPVLFKRLFEVGVNGWRVLRSWYQGTCVRVEGLRLSAVTNA